MSGQESACSPLPRLPDGERWHLYRKMGGHFTVLERQRKWRWGLWDVVAKHTMWSDPDVHELWDAADRCLRPEYYERRAEEVARRRLERERSLPWGFTK